MVPAPSLVGTPQHLKTPAMPGQGTQKLIPAKEYQMQAQAQLNQATEHTDLCPIPLPAPTEAFP